MALGEDLQAHLARGATTVCRCWSVARADGAVFGFTDHDAGLAFGGLSFAPDSGLSAAAIQAGTGLSVDNSEAVGVLSAEAVTEADIVAGRFDGAVVTAWLVNWRDVAQRVVLFRGTLGEVTRGGGAFRAELRSLAEGLNQPLGRVYQSPCSAVLGDAACGVDLDQPGYAAEVAAEQVQDRKVFRFAALDGFDDRWFEKGALRVLSGAAAGLVAVVKNDRLTGDGREIETWAALEAPVAPGDMLRIEAGCDKRAETCRLKFGNFLNFRGFPHVPGEDWLMSYPVSGASNSGGSREG
ncbi:DUF2163 domain-containing protein [Psychromarinibacter sp. C21-152]|uniref:DUF2163 domain-containing protein n=1 Tax=Psychromarinibacter sediminicola TaxID=3033385 RepID=A0AAE3T820_9RHOB|nr:DUF2163 domain-containing protein [Psychromarinibacter sediminicola]MDF0600935.1 DUF2163 domain-containing protein [Psychromarinibacter sediminicola]